MPAEYFEARERALLGERYDTLYAAPQETAARGVTVSALRTTPEGFAARADFPLRPSRRAANWSTPPAPSRRKRTRDRWPHFCSATRSSCWPM